MIKFPSLDEEPFSRTKCPMRYSKLQQEKK